MSDATMAVSAWSTWVESDAAVEHIRVVISRRFRNHPLKPTDVDDLVADVQTKLLEREAAYDPTRGAPSTLGSTMIPCVLSDTLDWLQVHFPDRYRALRLSRLAPRQDEDGFEYDPPEAEGVADKYGQEQAVLTERNEALHIALATLDAPTRRFVKRIMEEGKSPREAGARTGWDESQVADALARLQVAMSRAGISAADLL